jgi:hypothetical protein
MGNSAANSAVVRLTTYVMYTCVCIMPTTTIYVEIRSYGFRYIHSCWDCYGIIFKYVRKRLVQCGQR